MPLLKNNAFVADEFITLSDEALLPVSGKVIVSLKRFLSSLDEISKSQATIGVRLTNTDKAEALLPSFSKIMLIVLPFPAFADGRAYSIARQLRLEGYRGELRAEGNVLLDQLQLMLQVGFNSFEVTERFPLADWQAASKRMSLAYQRGLFRSAETEVWTERHHGLNDLQEPPQPIDQNAILEAYAGLEGRALIRAFARDFKGQIALLSSFGAESSVLLHMVSEVDRNIPVIFLDTQKLFPETLAYRDRLVRDLDLRDVRVVQPLPEDLASEDPTGFLHLSNPDLCCNIRKTLPMEKAFKDFSVMISGRKRFHGAARSDLKFISFDDTRVKIEPLAAFTALDLQNYMLTHQLPSHPLKLAGYHSIGCMPESCTSKGGNADNPREGRWMGKEKTECGIHFSSNGKIIRTEVRDATREPALV